MCSFRKGSWDLLLGTISLSGETVGKLFSCISIDSTVVTNIPMDIEGRLPSAITGIPLPRPKLTFRSQHTTGLVKPMYETNFPTVSPDKEIVQRSSATDGAWIPS